MSKSHFSDPVGQRPVVRVRADWSHATRRLIAGALCVACAGALFMPDAALAAEWVNVDGTQYNPVPQQATRPAPGTGTAPTT